MTEKTRRAWFFWGILATSAEVGLTGLARLTGGRVFELADVRQLDDSIPMREVTRTLETRDELWDAPLLFSAIILGLTAEWVLRKVYRMV